MRGRYLGTAAILLAFVLSVCVLLPSGSEHSSAAVPADYTDLDQDTRIQLTGEAQQFVGGGIDVTVSATGVAYIGLNENVAYVVADTTSSGNLVTIIWDTDKTFEFTAQSLSGGDKSVVMISPFNNTLMFEPVLGMGSLSVPQGALIKIGNAILRADSDTGLVATTDGNTSSVTVSAGKTFSIGTGVESNTLLGVAKYTARGEGDVEYVLANTDMNGNVFGVQLEQDQFVGLGTGAKAYYVRNYAVCNETPASYGDLIIDVTAGTSSGTVTTEDVSAVITTYSVDASSILKLASYSVATAPFSATVSNDDGSITVTGGTADSLHTVNSGDTWTSGGITYYANETSVFQEGTNAVLMSGDVTIQSPVGTSYAKLNPETSLTVTNATRMKLGDSLSLYAATTNPGFSVSNGTVTRQYTIAADDTVLDVASDLSVTLSAGSVTIDVGNPINVNGNEYTTPISATLGYGATYAILTSGDLNLLAGTSIGTTSDMSATALTDSTVSISEGTLTLNSGQVQIKSATITPAIRIGTLNISGNNVKAAKTETGATISQVSDGEIILSVSENTILSGRASTAEVTVTAVSAGGWSVSVTSGLLSATTATINGVTVSLASVGDFSLYENTVTALSPISMRFNDGVTETILTPQADTVFTVTETGKVLLTSGEVSVPGSRSISVGTAADPISISNESREAVTVNSDGSVTATGIGDLTVTRGDSVVAMNFGSTHSTAFTVEGAVTVAFTSVSATVTLTQASVGFGTNTVSGTAVLSMSDTGTLSAEITNGSAIVNGTVYSGGIPISGEGITVTSDLAVTVPASGSVTARGSDKVAPSGSSEITLTYRNASDSDTMSLTFTQGETLTAALTAGSVSLSSDGKDITVGSYAYSLEGTSATVSYSDAGAVLESGSISTAASNAAIIVNGVTVTNTSGTLTVAVVADYATVAFTSITLAGNTYASRTNAEIRIYSTGKVRYVSGSITTSASIELIDSLSVQGAGIVVSGDTSPAVEIPDGVALTVTVSAVNHVFTSSGGAQISFTGTDAVLASGGLTYSGETAYLGTIPVTHSGSGEMTLAADRTATISAVGGVVTTTAGNSLTANSARTVVSIGDDGALTVTDGTLILQAGDSVTVGSIVYTAVTEATVSISGGNLTLVSGSILSDSDSARVLVGQYVFTGLLTVTNDSASSSVTIIAGIGKTIAAAGVDGGSLANLTNAGQDDLSVTFTGVPGSHTLTLNSGTVSVISSTQVRVGTADYILAAGASLAKTGTETIPSILAGSVSIPVGASAYVGSGAAKTSVTNNLDSALSVSSDGVISLTAVTGNLVFSQGSDSVKVSGTNLTSSVTVHDSCAVDVTGDGVSIELGSYTYTSNLESVLKVSGGVLTMESGNLTVPEGGSVTVGGTLFTAYGGEGEIALISSEISIASGKFDIPTGSSPGSVGLGSGTVLRIGEYTYSGAGVSVSNGIVTFSSTDVHLTFNGKVTVLGTEFTSTGEGSVSTDGTKAILGTGTYTFSGALVSIGDRLLTAGSSPVTIQYDGSAVILKNGKVTMGSASSLNVNDTVFDLTEDVIAEYTDSAVFTIPASGSLTFAPPGATASVTIANSGAGSVVFAFEDNKVTIPAGTSISYGPASGSRTLTAATEDAVVILSSPIELQSGSLTVATDDSVKIGSYVYTASATSTTYRLSGTQVVLEAGETDLPVGASVVIGGKTFTSALNGTLIGLSGGSAYLTSGTVSVSGGFTLGTGLQPLTVSGDGEYTVGMDSADKSINFTASGSNDGKSVTIGSGTDAMAFTGISSATLKITSGTGAASVLIAKLKSGSAVLGSNAELYVPVNTGSSSIRFYGTSSGEVRLTNVTDGAPLVRLGSGSVSLEDAVDPTYENRGTSAAEFIALGSTELSLSTGTISVPVGSTVYVGSLTITADQGDVTVNSAGDVTLGANAQVTINDQFGSHYTLKNEGTEPMTQNVDQYVESHAFSGFNERRKDCISSVQEMYRTGQSQKVRALIDSTVEKLRSAVYDSSISYEENLRMLDHMVMGLEEQIRDMFDPEQAFQDYKESIIEELEVLHVGETSLSEQRIIDNAISSISSMSYNEQTYDDDMAAITEVLAAVEKNLSGYRSSGSAAFVVLREILKDYVKTEPVDDFEAIASLKQQYTSALEDIQYLNNLSSDANLQRLNDLRDAFDGAVYSIHSTEYQKVKNTVLAEMNALYQSYPSPTARELIDSAIAKVNLRVYDAQRVYTDNVNILSNLLVNLKTSLSSTLLGNIETFNAYCDAFLDRYDAAIASYQQALIDHPGEQEKIEQILGWIAAAKNQIDPTVAGHITYDTSKSLNDNINVVFNIAKNLEDQINGYITAEISDELDRVYNAALAHLNLNDREGVPTKLRDYIATTRTNLETEYNSEHSAMDKGLNINVIMTTYNTEMAVLIEQAEFYLNVDVGVKYLQDRYATSYAAVVSLMNTDIALLRALEYDTSKEMSQNLSELQERINNYSVALATLRKNTTQGDFENYREFRAWTVTEYLSENSTQAEKDLANQYAASIRAVVFNGKSIESNRYAVDRLFSEFEGKYLALMADQRKGDFDAFRNTLKSNIDAALLEGDGDSVRAVAERGKSWIGEFVFDKSADYDTNSANITLIKDATLLAIEYERSTDAAVKAAKVAQANSDILDLPGLIIAINAQAAIDDSQKVRSILENARSAVYGISYDFSQSPRDNIASAEAVMARFSQDLYEQRLMENSTTVGGIRADGKAIDGKTAEYPKDSAEIWGIVANATGIGDDASATISRVTPTLDPAAGTTFPASGSVANVLSNGKVLGAFDVTLYNGGERVTSFSGMYCIKILLPEDMRGFDSVQVAYVDEFGDVQLYDARVEGNYLVFETAHFSTFNVYGNIILHKHYDIYLYVVLIVAVVLLLIYLIRVVRYDANGGHGSTPATVFFCDGEGSLPENGFTREGYTFGGWSRKADGSDPISADAELSALGKIHFLKLYAVWNKEEVQQ